jgi:hypothetical protein
MNRLAIDHHCSKGPGPGEGKGAQD